MSDNHNRKNHRIKRKSVNTVIETIVHKPKITGERLKIQSSRKNRS